MATDGVVAVKMGILGTGMVGTTLATRLVELGHDVTLGARTSGSAKAAEWQEQAARLGSGQARTGTYVEAVRDAEMVINATQGAYSLEALELVGAANLEGRILIDAANPLDRSEGWPPTLTIANKDSLGEQIQRAYPSLKVVKALNTVAAPVMVDPSRLDGSHLLFIAGNDQAAKQRVRDLLATMGWPANDVIDLGDITMSRGTEQYLALWVRLLAVLGTPVFNLAIVREKVPAAV